MHLLSRNSTTSINNSIGNQVNIDPKSTKNAYQIRHTNNRNQFGKKNNPRTRKHLTIFSFLGRLLDPLVRFWAPFSTELDPKGCPKSWLWASSCRKQKKLVSNYETQEHIILNRKLVAKWEGMRSNSECFALYLMQNSYVRGAMQYWGIWCLNEYPKRPTSEPKTIRDQI